MKRKVTRIGPSSHMVSLPISWVRKQGIKKGDELQLFVEGNRITYSLDKQKIKRKNVVIDITNISQDKLSRYIELFYINNFDTIEFQYKNDKIFNMINKGKKINHYINFVSKRYIGMEIISQKKNSTVLKCFLLEEEQDLHNIEKRMFFLIKEMMDNFIQSLEQGSLPTAEEITDQKENIEKYIKYCMRILKVLNINDAEQTQLYTLYINLNYTVNRIFFLQEILERQKPNKKIISLLKKYFTFLSDLFLALYLRKYDPSFEVRRYKLINEVQNKKSGTALEIKLLFELRPFVDILNDYSRTAILHKHKDIFSQ